MKIRFSDLTPHEQDLHPTAVKSILGGRAAVLGLSTQLTNGSVPNGGDLGIGGVGTTYGDPRNGHQTGDSERPDKSNGFEFPEQAS